MHNTIQSIHPSKPQSGQRQIDETPCSATRVDQLLEECEINGLIMNLGSNGQHSYGYSLTDKAYRILETEEDPNKFTLIDELIEQKLIIYSENRISIRYYQRKRKFSLNSFEKNDNRVVDFHREISLRAKDMEAVSRKALVDEFIHATLRDAESQFPESDLLYLFRELAKVSQDKVKELQPSPNLPECHPLPKPDEDYPRYPGHGDAIAWLKEHWGKYLKYFGAAENRLYQDQLKERDAPLLATLKNGTYRQRLQTDNLKLADILPPKTDRIRKEVEEISQDQIRNGLRLAVASYRLKAPTR
ncbi:MAG: hypothetical protein KDI90_11445 [Alphaproteobacteria bacterium]|nr:hypothetical protein [Alphaproteobacteria bacterium]